MRLIGYWMLEHRPQMKNICIHLPSILIFSLAKVPNSGRLIETGPMDLPCDLD